MITRIINKLKSIWNHIEKYGLFAFKEVGKSRLRQFYEILRFRQQGFHESEYYILKLYNGNKGYSSFKGHLKNINILNPQVSRRIEFNKYIFSNYMRSHDLPTPKCYGILHERWGFTQEHDRLDCIENLRKILKNIDAPIVLKPVGDTYKGIGVCTIEQYDSKNDEVLLNRDKRIKLEELYQNLDAVKKSGIVIQDKIQQHEVLSKIHPKSVNCVRIYSLINTDNNIEILGAIVKFGSKGTVIDNTMLSGGVFTKVDLDTGELGDSYDFFNPRPVAKHPFTGEAIKGLILPYWNDVVNVAKKAHAVLPFATSFGWDIAISADGPVIIEANTNWDHNHFQKAMQMSLKDTILEKVVRAKSR